jgi:hypothetical protein
MPASMYAMNLSFNPSFNTVDSNDQLADRITKLAGQEGTEPLVKLLVTSSKANFDTAVVGVVS